MAQYSINRGNHIEYRFWLTFDNSGGLKLSRGQPTLTRRERAVSCLAKLPTSLFEEPELRATFTIPNGSMEPMSFDIEAAASALKAATGLDFDLRVISQNDRDGDAAEVSK